jgi:plasmid stabilization system protein ParE
MIQKVIFRQPAVEDVVAAAAWYEAHGPGLGERLIDEILKAMQRAQDAPELFRIVPSGRRGSPRAHKSFSLPRLFLDRRRDALFYFVVTERNEVVA